MSELLYEKDGNIATLTMNRPDRMNAISGPMLAAMSERLIEADNDRDVRCIILTGAGRAFCAGLDLQDASSGTGIGGGGGGVAATLDLRTAPPTVLHSIDTPVIASLNGGAAGYGMDLALGCDIRVASDRSKLAAAFTKRGVLPESGGTWLLPRLVDATRLIADQNARRNRFAALVQKGRTITRITMPIINSVGTSFIMR
jgi:enoyl-CoA hydratase/carnithine racemase